MIKLITGILILIFAGTAPSNDELSAKISSIIKTYPSLEVDSENFPKSEEHAETVTVKDLKNTPAIDKNLKVQAYNLSSEKPVGNVSVNAVENSPVLVDCKVVGGCVNKENPTATPTNRPTPTPTKVPSPTPMPTPIPTIYDPEPTPFRCIHKLCPMIACLDTRPESEMPTIVDEDCYCPPCVPPPIY